MALKSDILQGFMFDDIQANSDLLAAVEKSKVRKSLAPGRQREILNALKMADAKEKHQQRAMAEQSKQRKQAGAAAAAQQQSVPEPQGLDGSQSLRSVSTNLSGAGDAGAFIGDAVSGGKNVQAEDRYGSSGLRAFHPGLQNDPTAPIDRDGNLVSGGPGTNVTYSQSEQETRFNQPLGGAGGFVLNAFLRLTGADELLSRSKTVTTRHITKDVEAFDMGTSALALAMSEHNKLNTKETFNNLQTILKENKKFLGPFADLASNQAANKFRASKVLQREARSEASLSAAKWAVEREIPTGVSQPLLKAIESGDDAGRNKILTEYAGSEAAAKELERDMTLKLLKSQAATEGLRSKKLQLEVAKGQIDLEGAKRKASFQNREGMTARFGGETFGELLPPDQIAARWQDVFKDGMGHRSAYYTKEGLVGLNRIQGQMADQLGSYNWVYPEGEDNAIKRLFTGAIASNPNGSTAAYDAFSTRDSLAYLMNHPPKEGVPLTSRQEEAGKYLAEQGVFTFTYVPSNGKDGPGIGSIGEDFDWAKPETWVLKGENHPNEPLALSAVYGAAHIAQERRGFDDERLNSTPTKAAEAAPSTDPSIMQAPMTGIERSRASGEVIHRLVVAPLTKSRGTEQEAFKAGGQALSRGGKAVGDAVESGVNSVGRGLNSLTQTVGENNQKADAFMGGLIQGPQTPDLLKGHL